MQPPPEEGGTARRRCVWFVSCSLFLALLAGGALLVFYIAQPESPDTAWFPVAGMALVAVPWLFWLATCTYRCTKLGDVERPPLRAGAVAPVPNNKVSPVGGGGDDSSRNSRESEAPLAFN